MYGTNTLFAVIAVYLFFYYFDIFLERKTNKKFALYGSTVLLIWQLGFGSINNECPVYVNVILSIGITILGTIIIYQGKIWNKCVFAFTFNAIWMLMETLSGYLLLIYCKQFDDLQSFVSIGAFLSKILFCIVIIALKKVFTDDEIKELPISYSVMLVLIPIGSIYIMNNIFMLGYKINSNQANLQSAIAVVILFGLNVLIFYVYIKLADALQLKRITSVYEQQLELCERHQQERELSTLQLRDAKHNMRNNLVSILAYAQNEDCDTIVHFVNELMNESGLKISTVTNSGNIVVDSLIGYWYFVAKKMEIEFVTEIRIPMQMNFKGSDLSLILGNLIENAVEAAQQVNGRRFIYIQLKYDKENLLIYVVNNYSHELRKTKNNKYKSTKNDAVNHGVGLSSVNRTVKKYQGVLFIDDTVQNHFCVKIILYGKRK